MDGMTLVLALGFLASAIVVALGPAWQVFQDPEPVPVRAKYDPRPEDR